MACRKRIKDSWWNFCGETDMGQTLPVLCKGCGGNFEIDTSPLPEAKPTKKPTQEDVEAFRKLLPISLHDMGVAEVSYKVF